MDLGSLGWERVKKNIRGWTHRGDCTLLSFPSATPFTWGMFFVPEGMFSGVNTEINLPSVPQPTEREP